MMTNIRNILILIMLILVATQSIGDTNSQGLIKIKSQYTVSITIDRLEHAITNKGMTIFKRISHSDGSEAVGMKLRPTALLIFGNPRAGTPIMLCEQTAAIDLPQKALAYEDKNGQVWLAYNDPAYIENRHHIKDCEKPLQKISDALATFSRMATE
ncbi:MAG: DUF302 domain-containing protein [Gammaproteobacteria bacterium]|nr:DUF302 domain-containing protein [Gammaproteobacteria bacterium]